MNILDRYFLKQFLKPLAACLISFVLVMIVFDLQDNMTDFIHAKAPVALVLKYYCILIPAWLVTIMPITLLLALLYVLSDMSKSGEITAMRASGLDLYRLAGPYFLIGICVSIQMLCINLAWAPKALLQAKVLFESTVGTQSETHFNRVSYYDVSGNRHWTLGFLDVATGRGTDIEIKQIEDFVDGNKRTEKQRYKISARSGYYEDGHWTLQNVLIFNDWAPEGPEKIKKMEILSDASFSESPHQFVATIQKPKRMSTQRLVSLLKFRSRLAPKDYHKYSTELHTRIASPMANFVVFIIGIPFGIVGQRRSHLMAITLALGCFFGYWGSMLVLSMLSDLGHIPAWFAAWLPNVAACVAGVIYMNKAR